MKIVIEIPGNASPTTVTRYLVKLGTVILKDWPGGGTLRIKGAPAATWAVEEEQ